MRNAYKILVLEPEETALLEDLSLDVSIVRPDVNDIKQNLNSLRRVTSDGSCDNGN
jgi:hypothetical protein